MTKNLLVTYGDVYLDWKLGAGDGSHPTNPVRAKLATEMLVEALGAQVTVVEPLGADSNQADDAIAAAKSVHDTNYVDAIVAGLSSEWLGLRPSVGNAAVAMFNGTKLGVEAIIAGEATVAFNPQGAKHHARVDHGSGFCVLNDMAWAAHEFQQAGLKPLYIDWDIHAGDGVFHMLKGTGIPTISIHNANIYPGDREMQTLEDKRGELHDTEAHNYNFNLAKGEGDEAFKWAMDGAAEIIERYQPDVILVAAGADGHTGVGNLGSINNFTAAGFKYAAEVIARLANKHSHGRVLIGGAGGYQPLKETPETWALVVETIYKKTQKAGE